MHRRNRLHYARTHLQRAEADGRIFARGPQPQHKSTQCAHQLTQKKAISNEKIHMWMRTEVVDVMKTCPNHEHWLARQLAAEHQAPKSGCWNLPTRAQCDFDADARASQTEYAQPVMLSNHWTKETQQLMHQRGLVAQKGTRKNQK